jgi:hypothetical protein
MPEVLQLIIAIIVIFIALALALLGVGWRMNRVCLAIIKELKDKGAISEDTSVILPYAKASIFRFGLRDYRPKALESLLINEVVSQTDKGQYYLCPEKLSEIYHQTIT